MQVERLDVNGLFWLVDKPDDKVAGRLRFDPTEGARLDLIGKFKDFVPSGHNPPVSMNAIAGGRLLTLAARGKSPAGRVASAVGSDARRASSDFAAANARSATGTFSLAPVQDAVPWV